MSKPDGYPGTGSFGDSMYRPPRVTNKKTTANKETNNMSLQSTLEAIGESFQDFKVDNDKRLERMEQELDQMNKVAGRTMIGGGGGSSSRTNTGVQSEHSKKWEAWARKGSDPDGLRNIEASLSTLSDPDGGYLVPIEIEKGIDKLAKSSVAMRRIARVVPAKGEYQKPISKGGADGGWVTEMETRSETDASQIAMFAPKMAELYANPKISQKLLDMDDFNVGEWLIEELNDVFVEKEGTAFISGDGVGKPHGIIDLSLMVENASWEFGKTGYIASGHASLLDDTDALISLQHALKPIYRMNGTFLMNDSTCEIIRKMQDGDGKYIWRPGLQENSPDFLLGKPVEIDENMPDIGAGAYPIAFGDFQRGYTIVDHITGIRLLRDPYTTKGQVYFYTTKRVAGGVSNSEAIKFLKISE